MTARNGVDAPYLHLSRPDLADNGLVLDFEIVGEEEGFAQNQGQRSVAFKGKEKILRASGSRRRVVGDDAEVLIVGFHEDVAAAEMDFVGAQRAFHEKEFVFQGE